jgi:hypothetical protein
MKPARHFGVGWFHAYSLDLFIGQTTRVIYSLLLHIRSLHWQYNHRKMLAV